MAKAKTPTQLRREQATRLLDAEAASRVTMARANVLRDAASMSGHPLHAKMAADAAKDAVRATSAHRDLQEAWEQGVSDLEGTAPSYSDSEGNFAANADVARAGGIGVKGGNSTKSGAPAKNRAEAGVRHTSGQPVVIGYGGQAEELSGDDEPEAPKAVKHVRKKAARKKATHKKSGSSE